MTDLSNEALERIEALAKAATRFDTDGREDADGGSIEWQSMSPTTFATYERKADRDWYRDAPDVVLGLVAALREARSDRDAAWADMARVVALCGDPSERPSESVVRIVSEMNRRPPTPTDDPARPE